MFTSCIALFTIASRTLTRHGTRTYIVLILSCCWPSVRLKRWSSRLTFYKRNYCYIAMELVLKEQDTISLKLYGSCRECIQWVSCACPGLNRRWLAGHQTGPKRPITAGGFPLLIPLHSCDTHDLHLPVACRLTWIFMIWSAALELDTYGFTLHKRVDEHYSRHGFHIICQDHRLLLWEFD